MAIANGQVLTAEDFAPYSVNAWQSYTPTWSNLTLGNGTSTGQYCRVGNVIFFRAQLAFGTTTAITGFAYPSLPVAALSPTIEMVPGYLQDASPVTFQPCVLAPSAFITYPGGRVTATTPWTWASGDLIRLAGSYQPTV